MDKKCIIAICLFSSISAFSQNEWGRGYLILNSNDTLHGEVLYEEGYEIIQYRKSNAENVKTFSAFMVNSFYLKRNENFEKHYHRFYWNKGIYGGKNIPDFFQIVYDGKIKLLTKEKKIIVVEDFPSADISATSRFPSYREKVMNSYYLMLGEDIYFLNNEKKDILTLFPKYKSEINRFSKANSIYWKDEQDLVKVAVFLESLGK